MKKSTTLKFFKMLKKFGPNFFAVNFLLSIRVICVVLRSFNSLLIMFQPQRPGVTDDERRIKDHMDLSS